MGRQQYIARLALGRSAYEPPEPEDDAESLRRLEAALARSSGSPEPSSASPEQYVQQFDSSGRPINHASRTAVREMVRAQNDVLATVGVCYGIATGDKGSAHNRAKSERDRLESVMRENEVGLFIGAADLGVLFLANWWLDGIRHRIQVFKTFSDISFSEMFWIQRKHYGLRTILFAGMPAHIAFTAVNAAREFVQSKLINYLHFSNNLNPDAGRRKRNRKLIGYLDRLLSLSSFIFLSPLMIYSNLQALGLLPSYPLLPTVQSLVPLTATSPFQLPALSGAVAPRAVLGLVWSSVTSPIVLLYTFCHVRDYIDYQSFVLIRDWVTKPDYPDPWSIKGAIEDELDKDTIPGLGGSHLIGVGPELDINSSMAWPMDSLRDARDWLMRVLRVGDEDPTRRVPTASESATSDWSAATHAANMAAVRRQSASADDEGPSVMAEEPTSLQSAFQVDSSPILRHSRAVESSDPPPVMAHLDPPGQVGSPSEGDGSSQLSEASRDERVAAEDATGNRTGTEAEGIELQILGTSPLFANNISASPAGGLSDGRLDPYFSEIARVWGQDGEQGSQSYHSGRRRWARSQKHRVTTLSSHPADVIASHMSSYLATWMTLPLETVLQRTIAMSFLAAANTPSSLENAAFFLPEIYPPLVGLGLSRSMFRRGFRGGFKTGTMASRGFISGVGYAAQLMITNLIQLLVSWTLFQVGYSGVTWVGKKWFRWGNL
ncbi:MAG: hypothetical protein M1839_005985 [Geoglossum umbratile]|nr:MAG: hypothetical protein M1839_005985 [Geoglossum umbratile]